MECDTFLVDLAAVTDNFFAKVVNPIVVKPIGTLHNKWNYHYKNIISMTLSHDIPI